ncbi:hypothetical protein [Paenibacillus sp. Y412MC10]|uniref:hypothetical protein n=1 Tax=Geobacillus sp. (strain Y412MC10) TaxID=481743 RepID=UPI0011A5AB67|nr:hypothetical protein [Paenibacillus sp. Y412MC10]
MTTHGKERLTPELREAMVQENIAEIAMTVGHLISTGAFPKDELSLGTDEVSHNIITWAKEFEQKYEGPDFDYSKGVPELGNPEGYIDAIDNFTDLKLRDAGWLTDEYIADKGRFWYEAEYFVDIEFTVTKTIKVKGRSEEAAKHQAEEWWNGVSLAEAAQNADDADEFYIKHVVPVGEPNKGEVR